MVLQTFKDREKELEELDEVISSEKFELVIIYGRRRIGKTELILKATENRKKLYYLAVGEKNLERFYNLFAERYAEVSKLKMDWEILLDFLKDRIEVLVIDEFQNLIQENENILNIFQSSTDMILKNSKIKLFLLGSSISMMTSKVFYYKSPLYGRRTGSMELKAISFFELNRFFPERSMKELVEIYGFGDGIPHYLVKIDCEFWHWLYKEIRMERSFIKDEVDFLMRYEFSDMSTYKLILEAVAHGKTKLNDIKDFIKVKRTDISPYLSNLLEVKMIKRIVPITENNNSRMGRYYISDNFIKFWFRFIYPNLSSIEEGIFDTEMIRKEYSNYLGPIFEEIARQFLILNRGKDFDFTKIGKWWFKEREIDIIALNENTGEIFFCECKWQDRVSARRIFEELKEKALHVEWRNEKRHERYVIFAKSFKERINEPGLLLFDLKDMEDKIRYVI